MPKPFSFLLHFSVLIGSLYLTNRALAADQTTIAPYSCRNGLFAGAAQFQLAQIHLPPSQKQQHFYQDEEGCPEKSTCKQKSYLIPGDRVIVGQLQNQWACVWYPGQSNKGAGWKPIQPETVGWMPIQYLHFLSVADEFPLTEWQGLWKTAQHPGQVVIQMNKVAEKSSLSIKGEAFWLGAILDSGEQVIHTGEAQASKLLPLGRQLYLAEGKEQYDCQIRFTLLPPYLIAHDNRNCGGANVVFDGIYTRN